MNQRRRSSRGDERGQALVQYAMLIALVGACLVVILGLVGNAARRTYERSSESIARAQPASHGGGEGGGSGGGGGILTGSSGGRGGPRPTAPPADSAAGAGSDDSTGATATASR